MLGRIMVALLILPIALFVNVIGYYITLISLSIMFGCFAPPEAIQALAVLEFILAMAYTVLRMIVMVLAPDELPVQP